MTAEVYLAPSKTPSDRTKKSLFLAGSIDMGKAINWQERVTQALSNYPIRIFNPRRDDWDSSWKQEIGDAKFNEQVTWELDHLRDASVVCVYFDPSGPAPISLLELGLFVDTGKMIVCCPHGYWRKGNVDIVCARYGVKVVETIDELIDNLRIMMV